MADEQNTEKGIESVSYWKGCLVALVCVIMCMAFNIFGMKVFNLNNPWVGFVALTVWGTVYGSNISDLSKVWIGSAAGLLLGYLLWYLPTVMGPVAGTIIWFILFIPLLGGFIAQRLSLVCNGAALLMLTISVTSAQIYNTHEHLLFFKDLAYGAVCFWFIPWGISVALKAKKKRAANA